VKEFNCKNEEHVMWLKEVGQAMAKATGGDRIDVISVVNNNPLPHSPKMTNVAEWAYIHFQLAMKYANEVLNGAAFVPSNKTEVLFDGEVLGI
jgi:hypothetical protein